MKFNKTAVQKELDMAAEELEKAGHSDLAMRVDYYGDRLMAANAAEVPLLRRALSRVLDEANRRMKAVKKEEPPENVKKAQAATSNVRRVSDERKAVFVKRLREIAAKRQEARNKLEALRASRKERTKEAEKESTKEDQPTQK
jgi:hypothetical protein